MEIKGRKKLCSAKDVEAEKSLNLKDEEAKIDTMKLLTRNKFYVFSSENLNHFPLKNARFTVSPSYFD